MSKNREDNTVPVRKPGDRQHRGPNPEHRAALEQMVKEKDAKEVNNAAQEAKQQSTGQQQGTQAPPKRERHKVRPEVWAALEQMGREQGEHEGRSVSAEPPKESAQDITREGQAVVESPVNKAEPAVKDVEQAHETEAQQVEDSREDVFESQETEEAKEGQEPIQEVAQKPARDEAEFSQEFPQETPRETSRESEDFIAGGGEAAVDDKEQETVSPEAQEPPLQEEVKDGQEAPEPDKQQEEARTDGAPPREDTSREDADKRNQEQAKADDVAKDARKKKERDGAAFHKDVPKKGKEPTRFRGLLLQIRNLALRVYLYVKHTVERAIGRGRIPTPLRANRADFSRSAMDPSRKKDGPSVDRATQDKSKEKGRDWKEMFYHGIARRILGKDAYMYAIQQNEKQEASRQEKGAQEQAKQTPAQKESAGQTEKGQQGRTEHPGSQEKPERTENAKSQEQQEKPETQREPEEMKGKFNALHKIITNDLEDKYTNAKEAKEAYLDHYTKQLQEKLTELNQGEPVQVSAAREDGKLEIRINNEQEQYGGYPSFMGCSMIRIDIDKHLNVISAEAFVPTRQSDDGRLIGRKIDVSETLGAYIVSDLAKNFREDYNRGAESYNLTSRNEFEKTMRDAAAQGHDGFTIDNVSYSISVKDNQIQISQADGGKAFTIAMDADPQKSDPTREAYEAKTQELQDIEKELKEMKDARAEKATESGRFEAAYTQAQKKALEVERRTCDIKDQLWKIEKQISGKYPGAQKVQELKEQQQQLLKARTEIFTEKRKVFKMVNLAKADCDIAAEQVKKLDGQIAELEQKAGAMRDACRDAKEQYDNASLGQKETAREVYQEHTKSVMESRESSIRVFEEILPGQKNEIGGNFKLEDLNRAMEETGRTSMEEALNAQSRDMQHEPSIGEERESGREGREFDEIE